MLLTGSPLPFFTETSEVMEGLCYFGEVLDESVVKVAKADELSDCFDVMGGFPVLDSVYLDTFHFESIGR